MVGLAMRYLVNRLWQGPQRFPPTCDLEGPVIRALNALLTQGLQIRSLARTRGGRRSDAPHAAAVRLLAAALLSAAGITHADAQDAKACVEVAVPLEVVKAADVGAWQEFDNWKPPAVCAAVAARINKRCGIQFKDGENPFPPDADFRYPEWQRLDPAKHLEVLHKIVNVAWHPYQDAEDAWSHLLTQLKHRNGAKRIQLSVANIDLWNTGVAEPVYAFAWTQGSDIDPSDRHFYAAADLNIEGVGTRITDRDVFLADSRLPFLFRGHTYFWEGGSDNFVISSQVPPRGSNESGENCEFQKPGQQKYPFGAVRP
jgi:hypothetical protein